MRLIIPMSLLSLLILAAVPFLPASAEPPAGGASPKTTLVTIRLKDVPPEEAFAALARAGKIRFTGQPDTVWDSPRLQTRVSVDVTDKPFCEVLRDLCVATDMVPFERVGTGRISLTLLQKSEQPRLRFAGGPMFAWLERLQQTSMVSFADSGDVRGQWILTFSVFKDPGVHIDKISTSILEATDENGRSLIGGQRIDNAPWAYDAAVMERAGRFPCQFAINSDASSGRRLAHFKGEISFHTLDATGSWTVADVTKDDPAAGKIDDLTFALKRVAYSQGNEQWPVVWFWVTYPNVPDSAPLLVINDARLFDDKGQEYQPHYGRNLTGTKGDGPRTFQYSFGFHPGDGPGMGTPRKFILSLPKLSKSFTLPVEINDVSPVRK